MDPPAGLHQQQQPQPLQQHPRYSPLYPAMVQGLGATAALQQQLHESEFEYRQWSAMQQQVALAGTHSLAGFHLQC